MTRTQQPAAEHRLAAAAARVDDRLDAEGFSRAEIAAIGRALLSMSAQAPPRTETTGEATPRPWQADPDGEIIGPAPFDGTSIAMVLLNERGLANAALIVRAVNNHDHLVALLREMTIAGAAPPQMLTRANALLDAIEGQQP